MAQKLELVIKKGQQTYTQVDRNKRAAIYQSNQGHFEVFEIIIAPEGELYGKTYPERETYPGNERFGVNAWCVTNEEKAHARYKELKKALKKKAKEKENS